jgi:hypothetical protein
MKKPCINCPFKRNNAWYGPFGSAPNAYSKIEALKEMDEAFFVTGKDIFSCHMKNPDNTIFSYRRMIKNDCAGYAMMKENIKKQNSYPEIVNEFNETGPDFDLRYWAKKEGYESKLNLI